MCLFAANRVRKANIAALLTCSSIASLDGDESRRSRARTLPKLHHAYAHIPYQANRTLGVLSKMFNLAEVWGLRPDGTNPCRHIRKYPESKRERYLTSEELARLGHALETATCRRRDGEGNYIDGPESPYVIAAFKLLILTGCRLNEIRTLKWENLREDRLELPESKTGAKTVLLGFEALAILHALPKNTGQSIRYHGRR